MTQAARQYELSSTEFQRAITVLQQEQHSIGVSRAQRISYRVYTIFFFLFLVSFVGTVIVFVVDQKLGVPQNLSFALILTVAASFIGALLCIPLNFSLILKIARQKSNLRRLGFSDASEILWRAESRRRRFARLASRAAFIIGLLLFAGDLVIWIVEKKTFPTLSVFGVTFVVFSFLQEGKAWLDMVATRLADITQLEASLMGLQKGAEATGTERISLPRQTVEKLAEIDTERIVRGRANAIAEASKAKWTGFSVQASRDVLAEKANLDSDARLKVEEAIEKLMQQPTSDTAREDPHTKLLYQPIEGLDREIVYGVDESEKRVRLVSLRPPGSEGIGHG